MVIIYFLRKKSTEIWILISITDDLYLFKFSIQFVFLIFNILYTFISHGTISRASHLKIRVPRDRPHVSHAWQRKYRRYSPKKLISTVKVGSSVFPLRPGHSRGVPIATRGWLQQKKRRVETRERALDFFVLASRRRESTVRSLGLNLPKDLEGGQGSSWSESATSGWA